MATIEINTSDSESRDFSKHASNESQVKPSTKQSGLRVWLIILGFIIFILSVAGSACIHKPEVFDKALSDILSFGTTTDYTYESYTYKFDDSISNELQKSIIASLENVEYQGTPRYCQTNDQECQDRAKEIAQQFTIGLSPTSDEHQTPVGNYVMVGHFYWVRDDFDELIVDGADTTAEVTSLRFNDFEIYIAKGDDTAKLVAQAYGLTPIEIDESTILTKLESSEEIPALISSDALTFKHKLLWINEKYYLDEVKKDKSSAGGSLPIFVSVKEESIPNHIKNSLPIHLKLATGNHIDDTNLFTINMTGVTAITRRQTPLVAKSKDGAYPARKIGEFLANADITHISNEISFVDGCTNANGMIFCALPETIEAFKYSGVDVVELTGNHNNDYGAAFNTETINTYTENGMAYFGGGLNLEDARKPFVTSLGEAADQEVAFLGYNYWNAYFNFTGALASKDRAGANPYDEAQVKKDIIALKEQGKFVVVSFQFTECYSYPEGYMIYPTCYRSDTVANQETVFKAAIDSGADMVVGTQAHQPQTYEIYKEKPIFYGLGNLFFDQTMWPGTKHGIVLTHYFNNGEYIQTKLSTTNYETDLQTYVTTGSERESLLKLLKTAR